MPYILTGFTHEVGFRVFTFESVAKDRARTGYSVRADLALVRRYGIRVQELPLLCREILDRREESAESQDQRAYTYTEADMSLHAEACAVLAAAHKRKAPRRPPSENVGNAWRSPSV